MTDPQLQDLVDREQIGRLRAQFAWALDTRDWDLFGSLFAEEVDADLAEVGIPAGRTTRQAIVAAFRYAFRRPVAEMATQQLYGSLQIDLHGDEATVRSYLLGHHHIAGFEGGPEVTLRAAYTDQVARTEEGWKIRATSLRVFSVVGNAAIFA